MVALLVVPCSQSAYAFGKKKKKKKGQVEAITTTPAKKESKYDKFLKTPGLQTVAGSFITLHKTGDKLYFEMPLKYMGRELLIASVVAETSNPDITTVEEAKNMMEKTDKSRAAYYNYYTNKTWGMASSYNFSIDVSVLGIDETVEFMKSFIERRLNKRPPHFG